MQGSLFHLLQAREAWHLARGEAAMWVPSVGDATIVTSVVRVPEVIGSQLQEAALPAGQGASPQYVYPADDLHVTIANLDLYRDIPTELMADFLAACLRQAGPISLRLRNLAISRSTVFARVYASPCTALLRLRRAYWRSLAPRHSCLKGIPIAAIGFCNILRFQHQDVAAARDVVKRHSRTDFGSFTINEVEIVRTDKVLSGANTIVLAKCTM